jgi:hypothetical protein
MPTRPKIPLSKLPLYTLSSLSFALCLASSELLGLLMVALSPPATLLGFLSPPDEDAASTSPPFSAFWRTSRECCLDSSEVSDLVRDEMLRKKGKRLTGVVEVGLVAADNVS